MSANRTGLITNAEGIPKRHWDEAVVHGKLEIGADALWVAMISRRYNIASATIDLSAAPSRGVTDKEAVAL